MNSNLLFSDTETTGLPDWKKPSDDPSQPHLVQVCYDLVDSATRQTKETQTLIIKPDGWKWDETSKAFQTHGISFERAMDEGKPEKDVVMLLLEQATKNDALFIAHNEYFDYRMIRIALKRYCPDFLDSWAGVKQLCTMWEFKSKHDFHKKPNLGEAFFHYAGKEIEGAHTADGDVAALKTVFWGLVDEFGFESFKISNRLKK